MKAIEMKPGIYWVGGIDWDLRNFHGYLTQRGSTYNAYLIIDEKITLIDTVKHYLYDEMMSRIKSIIDPKKIDIVISNHVEMDHSGGLPALMELIPGATLYTSPNGEKGLRKHYGGDWHYHEVKSGEVLNLGKRSIQFILTPMVHWPDNMVSYMPEEKLLFSNDAFGQHIASTERFDDEYPIQTVLEEGAKYYANIVLPYGAQVQKTLAGVKNLDVDMIAPSHGIIWRKHVDKILSEYGKWSSNDTVKKAVIVYDTMWGATKEMAERLEAIFEYGGYHVRMCHLQHTHISDIMTEVIDAQYICVGSPTLNNQMLPTVASFLTYLKGLAPKNRKAVAFGAYGWSGQSVPYVAEELSKANFDVVATIKANYVYDKEALKDQFEKVEALLPKASDC